MIDIHAHILPGLDDGPEDIEESLKMCRLAERDGIHTIIATPHINPGLYEPSKEIILSKVTELNRILSRSVRSDRQDRPKCQKDQTNLKVLPGSDIHLDSLLSKGLRKDELLFINDNRRYILLELPDYFLFNPAKKFLADLRQEGIIPIISHPERNALIQSNVEMLSDFIRLGALSQITAMSIMGYFGKKAKDAVQIFLRLNLAHIIASDAHSSAHRPPVLSGAYSEVSKIIGRENAWKMVNEIPLAIIEGKTFDIPDPKTQ